MKLSEIKITPVLDTLQLIDISDEEYFGNKYSNYISNSRLNLLKKEYNGSPKKFFEGLSVNTLYSDSLQFGSAIHELVLQPESFLLTDINKPSAKAGLMADELYRKDGNLPTYRAIVEASKKLDYYKSSMNSDKAEALKSKCSEYWKNRLEFEKNNSSSKIPIYLCERDRNRVTECLTALNKNESIQNLLHPTGIVKSPEIRNESTIILKLRVDAPNNNPFYLKLKGKIDNFSFDFDTNTLVVNDLKTTGKIVSEFDYAIEKFSYYREMALYSWLLQMYLKKTYKIQKLTTKSNFLVVETIPGYYTKVSPMTDSLFKKGKSEFSHLLKLVAFYCCDGNGYEGFREDGIS